MICFEVWVNGEKVCLAGIGDSGVLTAIVTWSQGQGGTKTEDGNAWERNKPNLHVGGLVNKEHVRWTETRHDLEIGDDVIFKIIEAEKADEPIRKYRHDDPEAKRKRRHQQFKLLQREFEGVEEEVTLNDDEAMHLKSRLMLEYKNEFEAWAQKGEHE